MWKQVELSKRSCFTSSKAVTATRQLLHKRVCKRSSAVASACTGRANNTAPCKAGTTTSRRQLISGIATVGLAACSVQLPAHADDFIQTDSGLRYLDLRLGEGASPTPGCTVVVHWSGYTKGYQGKRIDNTSTRDEPYEFVLGSHQAIAAFEEAVSTMKVGGIRRIEVPGARAALGYPRDRSERFTNELISADLKIFKYRYGPQPAELGGQRALDFVLDNPTLRDFNRDLLFDIKLLAVRPPRSA